MDQASRYKWFVAALYVLALFMNLLDLTVTNVALPQLAREFKVSPATISWVSTSYLLGVAGLVLGIRFLRDYAVAGTGKLDLAGFALGALGLAASIYALSQSGAYGVGDARVVVSGLIGAAALVAFLLVERARAHPLID